MSNIVRVASNQPPRPKSVFCKSDNRGVKYMTATWEVIKYDNNRKGHFGESFSCSTLNTQPLLSSSLHHIYHNTAWFMKENGGKWKKNIRLQQRERERKRGKDVKENVMWRVETQRGGVTMLGDYNTRGKRVGMFCYLWGNLCCKH